MASQSRRLRHILQWLIAGSRGGFNRGRILRTLKNEPMNANQLAKELDLDYRTIRHHLSVLEENDLVTSLGEDYGVMYFVSMELEENYELFEEIWNEI